MSIREASTPVALLAVVGFLLSPALAVPAGEPSKPAARSPAVKTDTAGTRLLLPLYLVDRNDPAGVTTLFGVRNELDTPADVTIRYFRTDAPQAPQRTDTVTLAAKQVMPINIALVDGLQVDADGIARGFVVIEATTEGAVIQGEYFRVTSNEDFASGFRLLNVDPASPHNDLCALFSIRFLNGGGFDSGTSYIIWLDSDLAPDPDVPVLSYSVYDQPGELLFSNVFFADEVAFEVTAAELVSPFSEDFGAIEFNFSDGAVGHVSAILSAGGRYSVGIEAACGDF